MKHLSLKPWLAAAFVLAAVWSSRADPEQDLIAILQSSADISAKCDACKKLRVIGTPKSVPALAALLGEDRLSHAAEYALEAIPGEESLAAMRAALGRTSGLNRAGLVNSLGWRRDAASLPALVPLLLDTDVVVASAAASALSRIGGKEATAAFVSARDRVAPAAQASLLEGLLRCADALLAAADAKGAAKLYANLNDPKLPELIRLAAWRGQVMASSSQRAGLVIAALTGSDLALRQTALGLLRELKDPQVMGQALKRWSALPIEAQVAVLNGAPSLGTGAVKPIRLGAASSELAVRIAAWQAVAEANDMALIPALANAAAEGQAAEREAARDALSRLHGNRVHAALLSLLGSATPPVKVELVRTLGERGDAAAAGVLLQYASTASDPLRSAALEALKKIGSPDTLVPLLEIAAQSKSDADAEPAINAVNALCQASPDKASASAKILATLERYTGQQRIRLLSILPELGTPAALAVAVADTRSQDRALVKEAVRVLAQWPSADAAEPLLEIARSNGDPSIHALALRGAVDVSVNEADSARRLALLRSGLAAARSPAEKKPALSQLGQLTTAEALETALSYLDQPDLSDEAGLAAINIVEKLAPANPKLGADTATRVLAHTKALAIVPRAWVLRGQQIGSGLFIRDWLVCGPYSKPGVVGATALFPIPFGPEKGEAVQWKALPPGDHANLAIAFPNQDNCVAYLQTHVVVPVGCDALLLMGSDDGIKAWVNGEVVHTNNVDRGETPDQDKAPIRLKAGVNDLMLKITQGGGGWSASARIVGADGQPVPGLRVEATAPAR